MRGIYLGLAALAALMLPGAVCAQVQAIGDAPPEACALGVSIPSGKAVRVECRVSVGSPSIATAQVSVSTSATLVVGARPGRQSVDITVDSAVKCYLGGPSVTTTTGFPLQAVAGATKTIPSAAAIYAVCASTATLGEMEHF